jgi:hypothetical protein
MPVEIPLGAILDTLKAEQRVKPKYRNGMPAQVEETRHRARHGRSAPQARQR